MRERQLTNYRLPLPGRLLFASLMPVGLLLPNSPDRVGAARMADITLVRADGNIIDLSQYQGRMVVLDFWATWCEPCLESMPKLTDLERRHTNREVVFVSVNVDDDERAWRTFIGRNAVPGIQTWDRHGEMRRFFHARFLPAYVVIDSDGKVIYRSRALRLKDPLSRIDNLLP
jgi:thiol-disulfide isomerase/thioredoxin